MGGALLAALVLALQASGSEAITELHPDGSARSRCEARRDESGSLIRHGLYEAWYPNGRLEARGTFVDGLEQGEWELRHPNGKRAAEGSYEKGQRSGPWTHFTEQGQRACEGQYVAGRREGWWSFYGGESTSGSRDGVRKVFLQHHELREAETGWTWTGESQDGLKHGRWRALRPDGSTALIGNYDRGVPTGPWCFLWGDGTFDGGWFSAVYEKGRPVQVLLTPPQEMLEELDPDPPLPRRIAPLEAPSVARECVRRHLAGDDTAVAALLETPREGFQAAVAALIELDLTDPADQERAERIHTDILARFLGGIPEWRHESEADALTVLRWHALWESLAPRSSWSPLFDPKHHWLVADVRFTAWDRWPEFEELLLASPSDARRGANFGVAARRAARQDPREEALERALAWIVAQQQRDGSWDPTQHGGDERARTLCTCQCLLALLAGGYIPTDGPHAESVRSGLRWLVEQQDSVSGRVGRDPDQALEHALATQVFAEATGMTRLPTPRMALERAITHLISLQGQDGSWPGVDGGSSDACATAAASVALALAVMAGAEIDATAKARARSWLEAAVDPKTHALRDSPADARSGLVPRDPRTDAWRVALARMLLGTTADATALASDPNLGKALLRGLPSESGERMRLEPEYVCAGSHVAVQCRAEKDAIARRSWDEALKEIVLESQLHSGPAAGSWEDRRKTPGGNLWATTERALTLEVYRYPVLSVTD